MALPAGSLESLRFPRNPFGVQEPMAWPAQPTDEPWPPEELPPALPTAEAGEATRAADLLPARFPGQEAAAGTEIALAPLPGQDQATLPPGMAPAQTGTLVFMPTSFLLVRQPSFGFYRPSGGLPAGGQMAPTGQAPAGAPGEELPVETPVAGKLAAAGGLGALVVAGLLVGGAIKT